MGLRCVATKFSQRGAFAEIFIRSPRLNFLKSFSGLGKVMTRACHRFCLTDLGEFSFPWFPKYLEVSILASEVAFLIYLMRLLGTQEFPVSLEGADREKRKCLNSAYKGIIYQIVSHNDFEEDFLYLENIFKPIIFRYKP